MAADALDDDNPLQDDEEHAFRDALLGSGSLSSPVAARGAGRVSSPGRARMSGSSAAPQPPPRRSTTQAPPAGPSRKLSPSNSRREARVSGSGAAGGGSTLAHAHSSASSAAAHAATSAALGELLSSLDLHPAKAIARYGWGEDASPGGTPTGAAPLRPDAADSRRSWPPPDETEGGGQHPVTGHTPSPSRLTASPAKSLSANLAVTPPAGLARVLPRRADSGGRLGATSQAAAAAAAHRLSATDVAAGPSTSPSQAHRPRAASALCLSAGVGGGSAGGASGVSGVYANAPLSPAREAAKLAAWRTAKAGAAAEAAKEAAASAKEAARATAERNADIAAAAAERAEAAMARRAALAAAKVAPAAERDARVAKAAASIAASLNRKVGAGAAARLVAPTIAARAREEEAGLALRLGGHALESDTHRAQPGYRIGL